MGGGGGGGGLLSSGAEFSEGVRFLGATMFFRKHVISVATLLLIVHITMYITMYILISLI